MSKTLVERLRDEYADEAPTCCWEYWLIYRIEELEADRDLRFSIECELRHKLGELQRKHSELVEGLRKIIESTYRENYWSFGIRGKLKALLEQEARDE